MNLEVANQGLFFCQKRGAVVSQLVPNFKESVPPSPPLPTPPGSKTGWAGGVRESGYA